MTTYRSASYRDRPECRRRDVVAMMMLMSIVDVHDVVELELIFVANVECGSVRNSWSSSALLPAISLEDLRCASEKEEAVLLT